MYLARPRVGMVPKPSVTKLLTLNVIALNKLMTRPLVTNKKGLK